VLQELITQLGLDKPPQIEVEIIPNTELIKIIVEDSDPVLTREAANALAAILVAKSQELYSGGGKTYSEILNEQLAQVNEELKQTRREYESLVTQSSQDLERIKTASQFIALKEQTQEMLLKQYEQARIREATRANTLSVVDPAVTPLAPSKPRLALNFTLGFLVGLAGGIGLAFVLENLDTTLHTREQIERVTELSILGQIPAAGKGQQIAFSNGNSPQAEAFRRLRINLFNMDRDLPFKTLLVTSAEPGEGKSTVVTNLAFALAEIGWRVIVIDANLRRPALHQFFAVSNEIGLSNLLTTDPEPADIQLSYPTSLVPASNNSLKREVNFTRAVVDSQVAGVQVLTSGPIPVNPAKLLASSRTVDLLNRLTQCYDLVLLDTPPLGAAADAVVLAPLVDGVLLVIGTGQAREEEVRSACQQLMAANTSSVRLIVNQALR
jgi:non-specific protein-tyrosine kinase